MMHSLISRYSLGSISQIIPKFSRVYCRHNGTFTAELLHRRGLLKVSGDSSAEFLQGLMTNDIKYLESETPSLFCMFLNNKGRVLFDSIIYQTKVPNEFLIECDIQCVRKLVKHLGLYKVRRKIDISSLESELCVWAVYNSEEIDNCYKNSISEEKTGTFDMNSILNEGAIVVPDPRLPILGYRIITKTGEDLTCLPKSEVYDICRYKLGIGEGAEELQVGQSFPLEMNADILNGVSFDKGCYIGQELTARTFHTGVIRKRLMPLVFDEEPSSPIPYDTPIDDPKVIRKAPIGKLKALKSRFGIGLMRISETLEATSLKTSDCIAKSVLPFWWPNSVFKKPV